MNDLKLRKNCPTQFVVKKAFAFACCGTLLLAMAPSLFAGERRAFKFTECDKYKQTLSVHTLTPGDRPGHQYTLRIERQNFTTTDPEYGEAKTTIYDYSDAVDGTGTHRGTAEDVIKGGDSAFWQYQGTHKTVVKEGGAWETTLQGTGVAVGGTGKYKNAKGKETYRGKITPKGCLTDGDAEWEY